MIVLAPPAMHFDRPGEMCDVRSWRKRGWCIMELQARVLAKNAGVVLVLETTKHDPFIMMAFDSLKIRAGKGEFTCCANNHDFGNGLVECDKVKIREIIIEMINKKLEHYRKTGNVLHLRYLLGNRTIILDGLLGVKTIQERQRESGIVKVDDMFSLAQYAKFKRVAGMGDGMNFALEDMEELAVS